MTDIMHIASPIPAPGGRKNLCGAEQTLYNAYGGLDEAYRANVEGWNGNRSTCAECMQVATIAMGIAR